ncbi:YEATS family protein [Tieghemostelium lacteum]|uniref:YEATS family protein n=1 Tax=Tieghemostelium lacteum TaxID=361077 RepID=A0A152A6Y1_TIELA|nr:YEATS family protein [Tieghemostelium lacteum]|eukprot:KYR01988.1 YEATS family protein [Tieghemostelium lacteum]
MDNSNNNSNKDINKNDILNEIKDTLLSDIKSQLFSLMETSNNNSNNNDNPNINNEKFNLLSEQLLKLHQKQIELLNEKYSVMVDSKFKEMENKLIDRIDERLIEIDNGIEQHSSQVSKGPNSNPFSVLGQSLSKLKRKLIVNNDSDRDVLNKKLKTMIEKEFTTEIKNKDDDLIEIDTRILKVKEMLNSLGRYRTSERYHKLNTATTTTTSSSSTPSSSNVSSNNSLTNSSPNNNNNNNNSSKIKSKVSNRVFYQAKPNQFYQLLCTKCGKENFSNAVGFASHCKLKHLLRFNSTEEAVLELAKPVDANVVPLDDPSRSKYTSTTPITTSPQLLTASNSSSIVSSPISSSTSLSSSLLNTPNSISSQSSLSTLPLLNPNSTMVSTLTPLSSTTDDNDQETSSRFYIRKRVIVGNTSMQIHPSHIGPDKSTHKWMVYVRGVESEPDISYYVKKIWFYLHDSFAPNNLIEITNKPFQLSRRGWGEFPIRVKLFFHDHRNKPIDFIHHLKLIQTPIQYGVTSLGSESAFDLDLDRHFFDKREKQQKQQQLEQQQLLEKEKEKEQLKKLKKEQKQKLILDNLDSITINSDQIQSTLNEYANKFKMIDTNSNSNNNNNSNGEDSLPITSKLPYRIPKSKEKWLKWTYGKQFSSEFRRAKLIRDRIKSSVGKEFKIKDIIRWCRLNNKTPMTQGQEELLRERIEFEEKEEKEKIERLERLEREKLEKKDGVDVTMIPVESIDGSDTHSGVKKESESESETGISKPTKKKSKYQSKKEREKLLKASLPPMDIIMEPELPPPTQPEEQTSKEISTETPLTPAFEHPEQPLDIPHSTPLQDSEKTILQNNSSSIDIKSEVMEVTPLSAPLTPSSSMQPMMDNIFPLVNSSSIVENSIQQYKPQQYQSTTVTTNTIVQQPTTVQPVKPSEPTPHIQMFPFNLNNLFAPSTSQQISTAIAKPNLPTSKSGTPKKTLGLFPLFFCKYCGTGHQPDTFEQKQRVCSSNFKGYTYTSLTKSFPQIKITYPVNFDSDSKQPNPNAKTPISVLSTMKLPSPNYQIDWVQNILSLINIPRSKDPLNNDFDAEEMIYVSAMLFMKSLISETLTVYQQERDKEPREECIIKLIVPTHLHTVIKTNPLLNFLSNTALFREK